MEKENKFYLTKMITIIATIIILLLGIIFIVNKTINNKKETKFLDSGKIISEKIEFDKLDIVVLKITPLKDLEIKNIKEEEFDLEKSVAYKKDGEVRLNLVGKGKYEGLYLCDVNETFDNLKVQKEECKITSNEDDSIKEPTIIESTITLDPNGGNLDIISINVKYNDKYKDLPVPQKEGYTFEGWYINEIKINNGDKITIKTDAIAKAKWIADTYTLTLDSNGGVLSVTQINVTYDGNYTNLPIPKKDGYTFNGWYINDTKINNGDIVKITSNQTAKASWSKKTITIKFDVSGGNTNVKPVSVTYDDKYKDLPVPQKEGYTFDGWYIGDKKINNGDKVVQTENEIAKASWSANEYTINYELNEGTQGTNHPTSATFDKIITIDNPTRAGYTFIGWTITSGLNTATAKHGTTDSTVTSPIENSSTKIMSKYFKNLATNGSVTLTANWTIGVYTLTLDGNGISVKPTSISATYNSTYKDLPNLTRDGYTFNGWYIGSTKINNGDKVTITSNATAKALWSANTYTIELDGNGVNVDPTSINVIYNSTYKNLPNLVREGYTFNGWYIENIQIKNTDTVKVTSNQTAKASWSANTYKITLDGNGITINPEFVSAIYDDIYLGLPTPTREGYTFNGWYIGNTKINNGDKVTITSNATAKASWSANTYKVTLNTNEGSTSVTQIDVTYDDDYTNLPVPTRDGYTFNGWFINDTKINNGDTVKITSNQIATASWSANTYTISYELNGGSYGTTHPTTATYDSNVTIDNPTKLGYTFNGWIISGYDNTAKHGTSENAITNTIDNTLVISTYFKNLRKTSGTVTLTANWSANEYTISYELNNGSYGSSHPTSAIFDNVVTIDNPTREGYSFAGWTITSGLNTSTAKHGTTDSTVTSPIENTSTKIMSKYFKNLTPSGSVTLSANWSSNTYTLTLDGNGVSVSPTSTFATYDSTYKDLPNLTRDGYTFNGWYIGNTKISNGDTVKITSNATATASWSAVTYTLTLNANGGSVNPTSISATYDDEYTGLPTPTRDGYTFNGWYINDTKINNGDTVKITSNQTATASWTPITYTISYVLSDVTPGISYPTSGTYDSNVTISNPIKEGYTFTGWTVSGYEETARHGNSSNEVTSTIASTSTLVKSTYFKNLRKTAGTVTLTANWSANTYTINYELNGGSYGSSHPTSAIFDNIVTIDNPTKDGYSFAGWTISGYKETARHGLNEQTLTSPIENSSTKIMSKYFKNLTTSGSVTLTANWAVGMYTLTLDGDGIIVDPAYLSAVYDDTYDGLPNLVREGYTFNGWYIGNTKINNGDKITITSNATAKASWSAITSTLTLDGNGVSVTPTSISVTYDGEYTGLPTPTRDGYTFNGWYINDTKINNGDTVKIASNQTAKASWTPITYTISYELDGGTHGTNHPTSATYDDNITISNPTKVGYTFNGWTLSGYDSTAKHGTSENAIINTVDNTLVNSTYFKNLRKTSGNVTLTANWSANTYTISYELNGGSYGSSHPTSATYDSNVTISNPTRTGYTFTGWTISGYDETAKHGTDEDAVTNTIASTSTLVKSTYFKNLRKTSGIVTLTANWIAGEYTLTLDGNGVIVNPSELSIKYDEEYKDLPTLAREGYTFNGWYIGNTKINNGDKITLTTNTTAIASWTAITYTINYELNDGTYGASHPTNGTYDSNVIINNPTKEGYTFTGWTLSGYDSTAKHGTSENTVTNTIASTSTLIKSAYFKNLRKTVGTVTLTANWSANTYTINYELNGGSYGSSHPTSGTYDSNVTISNPIKEGYTFTGWTLSGYDSTAKHGTSENAVTNTIASTSTLIKSTYFKNLRKTAGTVTLTANWTAITYTINYELNDGTYGASHPTNGTYDSNVIISNPIKEGYTFTGWTLSGYDSTAKHGTSENAVTNTIASTSTLIKSAYFKNLRKTAGTVTLTANWSANTYKITLDSNGGVASITQTDATYDGEYTNLPVPTRDGYTFNGWYINGTKINNGDTVKVTSNQTAIANWGTNTYTISYELNGGSYGSSHPTTTTYDSNVIIDNPTKTGYTFTGWTISGYDETAKHGTDEDAVTNTIASTSTLIKSTYFKNLRKTAGIVTLTANWSANEYTISYELNNGSYGSSHPTSAIFDNIVTIDNPTKEGYTFAGWTITSGLNTSTAKHGTTDSTVTSPIENSSTKIMSKYFKNLTPSGSVTLSANWTSNTYTLTLDGNGVSVSPTSTFATYDSTYKDLPNLTRDGYTFNGWYIGNTKINNGDKVTITSNATATASWSAVTYTVTLSANGGSVNPTSISATYDDEYTGLPTPTRDGYTFNGWYINDTKINNGDTVKIITNSTATASWTPITYTISYVLSDVTSGSYPTSGTYDSNVTIDNPTKTGYTFTGWTISGYEETARHGNSSNEVTSTISSTSTLVKSTYFKNLRKTAGTVTLTANWSANTYTINYELNGGSYGTNHPTTGTFDSVVTIDNPTREGYSFAGWTITSGLNTSTAKHGTTDSTVTSPIENSSTKIMSKYFKNLTPSGSVTLTANWTSKTYTLTLDGNGVSVSPTSTFATYDSTYKDLPNLTRDGYTFNGWYIGNTKISNGDTVKITSNATATASWSAVTYTVTLSANGGSVNPTSISATYDDEYTGLPTPTRDGYTFNGWYINDTKINNGDTVEIITNSTATASWTPITYTIGYELNGGSYGSSHPTSGTYDSNVTISNPTKDGYTFTGWTLSGYDSTAKHGTSENAVTNTIASTSTLIKSTYFKNLRKTAGRVTLTANWSANTYTINYELNGGSYGSSHPSSATFDNVVTIDNPTREGYTFAGWTITSGLNTSTAKHGTINSTVTSPIENSSTKIMSKYFKNLTPSGSVTLSANWSSNTYTLTLDGNGVSVSPTSVSATYDSTYKDLPNLTRDGYTFNGWYIGNTKINNGDKVTITSNATATANWTAITYTINYVLNDGAYGTNHPTSGTYDTNVTISNPTREGYAFTGWTISGYEETATHGNSSSEVTSTIASTSTLVKSTYFKNLRKTSGIVTLTANWQEINLFKEHDWETIISNVQEAEENGTSYPYKVGETKTISMDVGDGYGTQTHTLRVANTTPCDGTLESQTACGFVVEFADVLAIDMMNDTSTNAGGWKDSALRTYINETLYNALPTEIKNGIIDVTVISSYGNEGVTTNYTTTDKLYLLSGMEVFGSNLGYDTATAETRQLDYYEKVAKVTSENYTGAKKQYYGSNESWWLRSAHYMFPGWFYAIFADGAPVTNDASNTSGISPAFRIGTPSGAEKIINLFKTSATDNGLEANDPDTNVRYVGASPKNYIYFNCADTYNNKTYGSDEYNYKNACELWRIIGVFDQRIKIVKNDFLSPDMAYDSSGLHVNVWANSTLNAYLNGEYYNSLNSQSKLQINTEATWYVGSVSEGTAIQVYNDERNGALTIQDYVGLIYPSDFGYAGTNCGGYTIYDYDNASSCGQLRNWLKPNSGLFWTMSPENGINPNVWRVSYQGWAAPYGVDNTSGIRPVVYLKTGIKLISGFGTTDEPYIIENIS